MIRKELEERLDEFTGMLSDRIYTDVNIDGKYKTVFCEYESYQLSPNIWEFNSIVKGLEQGDFDRDSLFILLPKELML